MTITSRGRSAVKELGLTLLLTALFVTPFLGAGKSVISDIVLLIVTAVLGVMQVLVWKKSKLSDFQVSFGTWVIIYLSFLCVSTIMSISKTQSIDQFVYESSLFVFLWLSLDYIYNTTNLAKKYLKSFLLAGGILTTVSLVFLSLGQIAPHGLNFIYPSYGHNRLGELLLLLVPYTLLNLRESILPSLILLGVFISFSRGVWFTTCLTPIVFWAISSKRRISKISKKTMVVPFVVLLICLALLPFWITSNPLTPRQTEDFINRLITKPLYITERLSFFSHAASLIRDRPLFGYGPATFQFSPSNNWSFPNSTGFVHNHLLQIVFEKGLAGSLMLVGFYYYSILKALRRKSVVSRTIIVGVILSLVHAQVDFDWEIPSIYLLSLFSLLLLSPKTYNKTTVSHKKIRLMALTVSLLPLSLSIFITILPQLRRPYYINLLTNKTSSRLVDESFNQWKFLDPGSAIPYIYDMRYRTQIGDFHEATLLLSDLPKSVVDLDQLTTFDLIPLLIDYQRGDTQVTTKDALEIITTVQSRYSPNDFFWFTPYEGSILLTQTIDKIIESQEFSSLLPDQKSKVYYLKFTEMLLRNDLHPEKYQRYINQAVTYSPENQLYEALKVANRSLISKKGSDITVSIDEIKKLNVGKLKGAVVLSKIKERLIAAKNQP